ncbi:hypothetical protein [Methylopila turkensis]|uniref:Uncharacterized protein n=1 Tax=Methylopila turkensis TaxID=1437816 RepID=A0A9W6JPP1_9HYPH|nr:hypothetical protein [Methylopila turkensis]GLK79579.1 hypothetical protein GCM10008174_13200 [Methylopila turkensis]
MFTEHSMNMGWMMRIQLAAAGRPFRHVASVLTFALLALSGLAGLSAAAELVGPEALKTGWFDGRTVSTTGPRGGRSDFVFTPDGKVTRAGGRAGAATDGTWRLDEDGFCMKLGQARRESCYLAIRSGDSLKVVRRSGGAFVWAR